MRTLLLFPGLLLLLVVHGYGQTAFGVKAGGNRATIERDLTYGSYNKPRIGFHLGFLAERNMGQHAFIRTELFFSRKGSEVHTKVGNPKTILDLDYLNVPLLAGYRLRPNLSVYAGSEVGYTLGNSATPKNYKDFDFGVDGGMLFGLMSNLSLDLRYTYGLVRMSNVNNQVAGDPIYDGQNRVVQFGLNYKFRKRDRIL